MARNIEANINAIRGNEIDVVDLENGQEATLVIVEPALKFISRVKVGKATLGLDPESNVTYVKMADYVPKPKSFTPTKKYKEAYSPPQQFKPAESYHFESQVEIVEGVTLKEYKTTYNELAKTQWITASQVFQTPVIATVTVDDKGRHILYDAIIYLKVKKEGQRLGFKDDFEGMY